MYVYAPVCINRGGKISRVKRNDKEKGQERIG